MATTFEIKLKTIKVIENGTLVTDEGVNGFILNFYHPNSAKDHKTITRAFPLKDNQELDYTKKEPILHKLDKLEIEGSTIFEVILTSKRKRSIIIKVFKKVGKLILKELIDKVPGSSVLSGASDAVLDTIFDKIETKDKITRLGYTYWEIDENFHGPLPLNLSIPKEIKIHRFEKKGDNLIKTIRTIKKGFNNCQVVLEFTPI